MAVLTAYFDESGIHEGDHRCVVAGFVGNDAQWQAFIADWIPAIRPRANLHMKELRWKQHSRSIGQMLAKLGPIPYKYNLIPVGVSVRWNDYNAIIKGKPRMSPHLSHPYVQCSICCMATVLLEVIAGGSDSVYFLFDRQEGLRRETMTFLHSVVFDLAGADSRVQGMDFIKRTSTVCLDPADYLAFILREKYSDESSHKYQMGKSIIHPDIGFGGIIASEQLEWMLDDWNRPRTIKETLSNMAQNPYFRGPKS